MATRSKLKARWIARDEVVHVQGCRIERGLFYLGTSLPSMNIPLINDNCLVDPTLEITRGAPDMSGRRMPYYPHYSYIPGSAREGHVIFLAGQRDDPRVYIGYPFLEFYGFERRLMLDAECDDAVDIIDELHRRLDVFGSNRSYRRYAMALLEALALKTDGVTAEDQVCHFDRTGDLSFAKRFAIGKRCRDGEPLSPQLLLGLLTAHAQTRERVIAVKLVPGLESILLQEFIGRFPNGFKLAYPPQCPELRCTYRAASAGFEVSFLPGGISVPDLLALDSLPVVATMILDACLQGIVAAKGELATPNGRVPGQMRAPRQRFRKPNPFWQLADWRRHLWLHNDGSRDDGLFTIIEATLHASTEFLPPASTQPIWSIDRAQLDAIRVETAKSAALLDAIFREKDQPTLPLDPEMKAPGDQGELDPRTQRFLRNLLTSDTWRRADFDALAKQEQLLPSAATAAINTWSLDRFDEVLISGDDPVMIDPTVIPPNE